MLNRIFILFAILNVFNAINAFAQSTETVTIIKNNNDTIYLETALRYYKGKYIFPEDGKDFIKGNIKGERLKLPKSEIKKIILMDGSVYDVFRNKLIGTYISKGKMNFFKAYTYGHATYFGGTSRPQTSLNKVASVTYYSVRHGLITEFDRKYGIEELAQRCDKFRSYVEQKKRIKKNRDLEEAFKYYSENCN